MTDELLINATPGEIRAAVVNDGMLTELFVERRSRESLVGNIYQINGQFVFDHETEPPAGEEAEAA